jgi:hypothetical protein
MVIRPYLYSEWITEGDLEDIGAKQVVKPSHPPVNKSKKVGKGKKGSKTMSTPTPSEVSPQAKSYKFVLDGNEHVRKLDPSTLFDEVETEKKARQVVAGIMEVLGWSEDLLFKEYNDPSHTPDLRLMPVSFFLGDETVSSPLTALSPSSEI